MIRALSNMRLGDMVVIDIETVPIESDFSLLSEDMQSAWEASKGKRRPEDISREQHFFDNAGLYAAFGKIVCISVGYFRADEDTMWIDSYARDEEASLLVSFFANRTNQRKHEYFYVGHNIKGFDCPYICQRALVNGLSIPAILDMSGKKPWEMNLIDTQELWLFGRNYRDDISKLGVLAPLFGLPSSKDDLDGSKVGITYWVDNDLPRIVEYCQKEVIVTAQLLRKFMGMPIIEASHIDIKSANYQSLAQFEKRIKEDSDDT